MENDVWIRRLRAHAGLPSYEERAGEPPQSLCRELRRWQSKGGTLELMTLTTDVLDCLEEINATTREEQNPGLSRPTPTLVAYSAAQIVDELLRACEHASESSVPTHSQLLRAARIIAHALAQTLAGDIPSLRTDLEHHNLDFLI